MGLEYEICDRKALSERQFDTFRQMLAPILESNVFYTAKLNQAGIDNPEDIQTFEDYTRLPFTTKAELSADQTANMPYGTNVTFTLEHYIRVHQTSGTTGEQLARKVPNSLSLSNDIVTFSGRRIAPHRQS